MNTDSPTRAVLEYEKKLENAFLDIAETMSRLSKCTRLKVAAIIVKNRRIISTRNQRDPAPGSRTVRSISAGADMSDEAASKRHHRLGREIRNPCGDERYPKCGEEPASISTGAEIYMNIQPCQNCLKMLARLPE